MMVNSRIRPIVDCEGLSKFTTWAVYLHEEWTYVDKLFSGQLKSNRPDKRLIDLKLNLYHESVHFIQALSTSSIYICSVEFLSICSRLVSIFQREKFELDSIKLLKTEYHSINMKLDKQYHSLSVRHLAEAMAVAESFCAVKSFRDYSSFIDYYWPFQHRYRRVHEVVRAALESYYSPNLISPLCFAALNSRQPVKAFWIYLKKLIAQKEHVTANSDGIELLKLIDFNVIDYLPEMMTLVSTRPHRFLKDIHDYVSSTDPNSWFISYSVNPSKWLPRWHFDEHAGKIMPYLIICSGGGARVDGIGVEWPKERIQQLNTWTAVMGACERMLSDNEPYLACSKSECPVHRSRLCNSMYPQRGPWHNCIFHKILRYNFRMDSGRLMQIRDSLQPSDESKNDLSK